MQSSVGRAQGGWPAGERQKWSRRDRVDGDAALDRGVRVVGAVDLRHLVSHDRTPDPGNVAPAGKGLGDPAAPSAQVGAMLSAGRNLLGDGTG